MGLIRHYVFRCHSVFWKKMFSLELPLLVFTSAVICFPPFQWNLYLPLKIAHKQSSLKSSRNFSQYAKLCSQTPLWLSCDVFLRYANMTFLWLLFNPGPLPPSLFLFLSLCEWEVKHHLFSCSEHYSRLQHLFGTTDPFFLSAQVSSFHFHRDEKSTFQ